MSWRVEFRPEVEADVAAAAAWYAARQPGLGMEFEAEVIGRRKPKTPMHLSSPAWHNPTGWR